MTTPTAPTPQFFGAAGTVTGSKHDCEAISLVDRGGS